MQFSVLLRTTPPTFYGDAGDFTLFQQEMQLPYSRPYQQSMGYSEIAKMLWITPSKEEH